MRGLKNRGGRVEGERGGERGFSYGSSWMSDHDAAKEKWTQLISSFDPASIYFC